jgi:hypothetical protein
LAICRGSHGLHSGSEPLIDFVSPLLLKDFLQARCATRARCKLFRCHTLRTALPSSFDVPIVVKNCVHDKASAVFRLNGMGKNLTHPFGSQENHFQEMKKFLRCFQR